MARDGFQIFDSDTHVGPAMEIIERYLSASERELLEPFQDHRQVHKRTGRVTYDMGARTYDRRLGQAQSGTAKAREYVPGVVTGGHKGRDPHPEVDRDPNVRISDMDFEGVDVNLMLPSAWWGTWTTVDPVIESVMYRAYHAWMKDYCGAFPDRLFGVVLVSGRDVKSSVAEIERCAQESWPLAVFCYAPYGMPLDHPDLEPYWAAAQANDLSVVVHTFTSMPPYAPGSDDSWSNRWLQRVAAHPWCGQRNMAAIIGAGVLDRYPDLRLGVLEAGHGWLPSWVKRLDEHAKTMPQAVDMEKLPSDYVSSGRYFQSIEMSEGEDVTQSVIHQLGEDILTYASDYPHAESWFPKSVETVMSWDLAAPIKRKLFWDNAVRFYARYKPAVASRHHAA